MTAVGELDRALVNRLAPKLRFYFAKSGVDGWIRDEDREEIIDALGGKGEYHLCEESLPHDFCKSSCVPAFGLLMPCYDC